MVTITRVAAPIRQQVIEQLREAVTSFIYQPGQRLIERDLCERYQVSRTVVREALRQLEAEGLVALIANKGPVVARISAEEALALYEVRSVLEPMAAKLFCQRATSAQMRDLAAKVDEVESAIHAGDLRNTLRAKDAFYDVLLDGAGNSAIASMFRSIQARIRLLRAVSLGAPGRSEKTIAELRAMLAAIEQKDTAAVWAASEAHVNNAAHSALSNLKDQEAAIQSFPGVLPATAADQ
jgi:GntR family transcriptional regulator, trigonelline degradation regulator